MATGDVIDFLEREGYDLDFIKTANRYLSYDSEHLILQCKNDILEFGEKELVKMYNIHIKKILYVYAFFVCLVSY